MPRAQIALICTWRTVAAIPWVLRQIGEYFVYFSHWAGTECHLVCVRNGVRLRGGGTGGLVVPRVPRRARGRAGPGPAIPGRRGLRRCPSKSGGGAGVGRTVRGAAGGRG